MKFCLGFILGLMTLSAIAQTNITPDDVVASLAAAGNTFMRAGGDGADGKSHVIQVDRYGYVICSQLPPPTHWLHGMPPENDLNQHEK